jgi:serine protease Do
LRKPLPGRFVAVLAALAAALLPPAADAQEVSRRTPVVIAVEKASPAVVNISTEQIVVRRGDPFLEFRDPFFDQFFREYFDRFHRPGQFRTQSLGSGVLIDPEGYIVTNEHVVRKASKIHVTLSDGTKHEGKPLSTDSDSDLALIKIDSLKPFPTIRMGRSDDLMIGETVIALGNPFGLEGTVTVGVLSAKNRSVNLDGREAYSGLLQADAAINPGNSGGALVNINGELIGVNVAIYAQAEGIGFAIPVDRVREAVKGLFNYRLIKKTDIGVKTRDLGAEDVARHKLAGRSGALVGDVDRDSPAANARLAPGDVITAVDGRPVADTVQFFKAMLKKDVGDAVELRVVHSGTEQTHRLIVRAAPKPSGAQVTRQKLGVTVQAVSAELAESFGLRKPAGILVTAVDKGGPAERAGLEQGDIILRVAQFAVNTLDQLAAILEQVGEQDLMVLILRRGRLYRVVVPTR